MNLQAFQNELRELIFFRDDERAQSPLWPEALPRRLNVYRNNTRTNWTDTLDHDFPLTRKQFSQDDWEALRRRFFIKHPPAHWELNNCVAPFAAFLTKQKLPLFVKELADYEWHDLKVFIDRSDVQRGSGRSNPTAVIRAYRHQLFDWVQVGAPVSDSPAGRPEVLVFYRDSRNTCHIREADPLMILFLDHFAKPGARLEDLESVRRKILPENHVPLDDALAALRRDDLIL